MPPVRWVGTVHHGLPRDLYRFSPRARRRLPRLPRPHLAREAARTAPSRSPRAGMPLRIAAKVDNADRLLAQARSSRWSTHPLVEFVGEIGERDKAAFLGGATALLFPIDWPEPFGLVMIEAMACGTPVIAFRRGSVPEVIDHGVTGFIVDSSRGGGRAAARRRLAAARPRAVRATFEQRFTERDGAATT